MEDCVCACICAHALNHCFTHNHLTPYFINMYQVSWPCPYLLRYTDQHYTHTHSYIYIHSDICLDSVYQYSIPLTTAFKLLSVSVIHYNVQRNQHSEAWTLVYHKWTLCLMFGITTGYFFLPHNNMDDYFKDANKFKHLPWEDHM